MSSKKIGTISLNINTDDFNYGAILHSYAFQKYVNDYLKLDCEIINYVTPKLENYNRKNPLFEYIKQKRIKTFLRTLLRYNMYRNRYKKFEKFEEEHMKISSESYNQTKLNMANLSYDTVICESDVIWSPGFVGGKFDKAFFLALDSMKDKKKIAYAPSMADCDVKNQEEDLIRYLSQIDYISCRETYEKKYLDQFTDKKIEHVLDPVFLLEKKDYEKLIIKRLIKQKYILLYLPVNDNKKLRKSAREYARKNNLKILEISTQLKWHFGQKNILNAGVQEFLSAIANAEIVFTNSFHAICFSMIFNREFYVFSRKYNGKIRDICQLFDLDDRFLSDDNFEIKEKINYDLLNKKIENKISYSKKWLDAALSGEKYD